MPSSLQMEHMPVFPNLLGIQVTPQPLLIVAVIAVIAVTAAIATAGPTRSSWTPLKRDSSDSWNRLNLTCCTLPHQMWLFLPLACHVSYVSTCSNKYCTGRVGGQFCSPDSQRNIGLDGLTLNVSSVRIETSIMFGCFGLRSCHFLSTYTHKISKSTEHLVLGQG